MNCDALIREALLVKNEGNYESASCATVSSGSRVRGYDWAKLSEMGDMHIAKLPLYLNGDDEVMLSEFSHTLIIGSTGTGKSEVVVKNWLEVLSRLDDEHKPSMLVTDLKGDISRQFAGLLGEKGYKVIELKMKSPYSSMRYNFLTQVYDDYHEAISIRNAIKGGLIDYEFDGVSYRTKTQARAAANAKMLQLFDWVERTVTELANIIVPMENAKEPMWGEGGRLMLSAIMLTMLRDSEDPKLGMTRERFTISNACRIAFSTQDDCSYLIEWLGRADDLLVVKNAIAGCYNLRAKATRDSYISVLNSALRPYTNNTVSVLTATSDDIDLREIATRKEPYAIFLVTDDQQKVTNSLSMMLINNLINELSRYADQKVGEKLQRDFVFLMDEFANMPAMPDVGNKITTLRSRRVWLMMAVQSIQQLRVTYGEDTSEIIQDNCDLTVFLGSNNQNTKEIFSRSMGERTGISSSYQKGNDGNTSESIVATSVPVVRISDLDMLSLGEFYVRSRKGENLKSYMIPFFRRKDVKAPIADEVEKFREYTPEKNVYDIESILRLCRPKRPKMDFDF